MDRMIRKIFLRKEGKMTIKKLSLAAFLSLSLAAGSVIPTMAETLPLIAACPLAGCNTPVTPDNAPCPNAMPDDCDCIEQKADCGCDVPSRGCRPKKEHCKKSKCRCEDKCAECAPSCDTPAAPATAMVPQKCGDTFNRQVYAYPQFVFGNPNYTGTEHNGFALGYGNNSNYAYNGSFYANGAYHNMLDPTITGAAAPACGCNTGCGCAQAGIPVNPSVPCDPCKANDITGAAAPMPVIGMSLPTCGNAVPVQRNTDSNCDIEIQSSNSMEALKKSYEAYDMSLNTTTGAAAPLVTAFEDIPPGFWANCDINKLTENNIIAGYPDRTFKPNLPISRAEMASMITKGLNVDIPQNSADASTMFKDVPRNFWGRTAISNAVAAGLMAGYPDNTFKPNQTISKTEAMTILAKGINCPMDECKADSVLSQYCDGANVPSWAKISVAKVLDSGALKDSPQPNKINPYNDASRAELASMLQNVRVAMGYDNNDVASLPDCDCTGGAAFIEKEEIVSIPTLQVCFNDEISAKSAQVGDRFAATTTEEITINGCTFPCGSRVYGKVTEVVRPSTRCSGAIRLSFDKIESDCQKADLPKQMLCAQVNTSKKNNFIVKALEAPFAWAGGIVGVTGRTIGGVIANLGNAVENTTQGVGVAVGELSRAEFIASGRSILDSAKTAVKAPFEVVGTTLSGVTGLLQYTGDELWYLVDTKGNRVASVNPKEKVTIAFDGHQ